MLDRGKPARQCRHASSLKGRGNFEQTSLRNSIEELRTDGSSINCIAVHIVKKKPKNVWDKHETLLSSTTKTFGIST